jgi:hypothetical protein
MNPLIQLKKATPVFFIALVLACFALSPQAFAQGATPGPTPTFSPPSFDGCRRWQYVTISAPGAATISVWGLGGCYIDIPNNSTIPVGPLGRFTLYAQVGNGPVATSGVYKCHGCWRCR